MRQLIASMKKSMEIPQHLDRFTFQGKKIRKRSWNFFAENQMSLLTSPQMLVTSYIKRFHIFITELAHWLRFRTRKYFFLWKLQYVLSGSLQEWTSLGYSIRQCSIWCRFGVLPSCEFILWRVLPAKLWSSSFYVSSPYQFFQAGIFVCTCNLFFDAFLILSMKILFGDVNNNSLCLKILCYYYYIYY